MKLYLTIHATSTWNELRKAQGHCDTSLSERGREAAKRLAGRRDLDNLRCIVTSDLKRAIETAAPLAERLGIEPMQREDIREGNWAHYHRDPAYPPKPCGYGFEEGAEVEARARSFLKSLENNPIPSPALIVSHGFFASALLTKVLGVSPDDYKARRTSLTTLEWDGKAWRVLQLTDGTHLDGWDQEKDNRNAG